MGVKEDYIKAKQNLDNHLRNNVETYWENYFEENDVNPVNVSKETPTDHAQTNKFLERTKSATITKQGILWKGRINIVK